MVPFPGSDRPSASVRQFIEANGISGIFVGGSMDWKLRTMGQWAKLAHHLGLQCHVGRVGPVSRMLLAEYSGADSIDSTTWVQRKDALPKYIRAYREQTSLPSEEVAE